jgi:two-component system, OmpR family, phosphate regulon sensor histidine kinase PhoR
VRRRVLNVVGHALRTPVTTLTGIARELAASDDAATRAELAAAVERTADVVERLLDDLLLASGVTTTLPVGEPEPSDVAAVSRAAWGELASTELDLVVDGDVSVATRPGVLDRIMRAVLDNADKYGGGAVAVRARRQDDRVVVDVTTGGEPPSPEEIGLVFEPFYRSERAVMASAGLGVGLTIAQVLARQHGGDVTLEVSDGDTVTRVELPAA